MTCSDSKATYTLRETSGAKPAFLVLKNASYTMESKKKLVFLTLYAQSSLTGKELNLVWQRFGRYMLYILAESEFNPVKAESKLF